MTRYAVIHTWPAKLGIAPTIMPDVYDTLDAACEAARFYRQSENTNPKGRHKYTVARIET
jgi:hypothetical protein